MSEEQTEATIQWRVLTCEDPHTYRVIPVKKGHSLEDVRKFVEQNWRTALNPNDFVFSWKEENIAKELEPFVKVYELASKHADGLKIVEGEECMDDDYIIHFLILTNYVLIISTY